MHEADDQQSRQFTFDAVYGADSTQEELYEENFRLKHNFKLINYFNQLELGHWSILY